jgi:hypothetical protein
MPPGQRYKYAQLLRNPNSSEEEDIESNATDLEKTRTVDLLRSRLSTLRSQPARLLTTPLISLILLILLTTLALLATIRTGHLTLKWSPVLFPTPQFTNCGTTASEASALSCRFEIHNFARVPPECYDVKPSSAWDTSLDWGFSRARTNNSSDADTDETIVAPCCKSDVTEV